MKNLLLITIMSSLLFPIIGGWEVSPECPECKYPFNVSLQTDEYYILSELQYDLWWNEGGLWQGHFCQGTLVDKNWVLTTVNCIDIVENASDIWVEIGLHNIDSEFSSSVDSISVENIYIHPDYDVNNQGFYNYALLKLSEDSNYDPIQLVSNSTYEEVGDSVTVMGWGARQFMKTWIHAYLLFENNSTIGECNQLWSLHESLLCLDEWDLNNYDNWEWSDFGQEGFPGGACDGDWGASLITENDNGDYELLGNYVSGCVISLYNQNRFSRISTASDWIYSYIGYPCEEGAFLDVSIVFDDNPNDISWELWYKGQNPDSGYLYLVDSGNDSSEKICLSDEGVYEFIIYDEAGDGLCCNSYPFGSYSLILDTGEWSNPNEETIANGGTFDFSEITQFAWPDIDNDLFIDSLDNCPYEANEYQNNYDGDSQGDVCDWDDDNDSVPDINDPNDVNSFICGDSDGDGCDDCSSGSFDPLNDCIFILGDINNDGSIDVLDVVWLVNIVLGVDQFNPAGDLNSDGTLNVLDVVALVNIILNP